MYFIFHYLISFTVMALGVGLMIVSYFMKDWDWCSRLMAFGFGLSTVGHGGAYLWGFWIMYFTFHHLIGFSIIALGVGLIIVNYFMKDWSPKLRDFGVSFVAIGFGLVSAASGFATLWG